MALGRFGVAPQTEVKSLEKRWQHTALERVKSFETFCCPELLELLSNPSHPSLHFKKVGKYRAVRVGLHCRALAVEAGDDLLWF